MTKLLSRNEFKIAVFTRDNNQCVVCGECAVDAHHLLDRKLFADGGYYLDNGVSLCAECHWKAERSELSCQELRQWARIKTIVLPEGYVPEREYDKWGKPL